MIEKVFAAASVLNINPSDDFVKKVDAGSFISTLISIFIIIAFITAFFFLLQGGLQWISSGGDEGKVEAARNRITQAIIGLVIVVSVWALFGLVENFLGVSIFGATGGIQLPTIGGNAQLPACDMTLAECGATSSCPTGCNILCEPSSLFVGVCGNP